MGIQHVFDLARKRNTSLQFTVQLAPYVDDVEELARVIHMLTKLYAGHPNYLHLQGKPVLCWFWSSAYDGHRRLLEALKQETRQYSNIAVSLRLPNEADEEKLTFGLFEGFVPFSPLELADEENWDKVWAAAYRGSQKAGMRYRIAALSPGYDDTGLDDINRMGNPYRLVHRNGGGTYKRGMQFVESLTAWPDLIMISTFNEFHENTHIEPSQNNGMRYIEMTKSFVARIGTRAGCSLLR